MFKVLQNKKKIIHYSDCHIMYEKMTKLLSKYYVKNLNNKYQGFAYNLTWLFTTFGLHLNLLWFIFHLQNSVYHLEKGVQHCLFNFWLYFSKTVCATGFWFIFHLQNSVYHLEKGVQHCLFIFWMYFWKTVCETLK